MSAVGKSRHLSQSAISPKACFDAPFANDEMEESSA